MPTREAVFLRTVYSWFSIARLQGVAYSKGESDMEFYNVVDHITLVEAWVYKEKA